MLHMNYTNEYIIGTLFKRANLSRKIGLAVAKLLWLGCCWTFIPWALEVSYTISIYQIFFDVVEHFLD